MHLEFSDPCSMASRHIMAVIEYRLSGFYDGLNTFIVNARCHCAANGAMIDFRQPIPTYRPIPWGY
jgi:hypothetical protein